MYRFFTEREEIQDGCVRITGADAHHIRNVLRMRQGEVILVSCGDEWEYTCEIESFSDSEVLARITDAQKPGRELKSRITLYQCMPKKDKFESIIQKSVELGVYKIVPVESARCVVKIDAKKKEARRERWNAIAKAAAKQSKRMIEPQVEQPVSFAKAVEQAARADAAFLPYECAEGMAHTRELFGKIVPGQSVSVMIGPEGGFEEAEVKMAEEAGIQIITLGRRILRTETAGPAVLSVLMYLLERDGE